MGGGLPRVARDHFDPFAEERTQEGKSVLYLRGAAKRALEAASEWALFLLGVAWRILKTASSWSEAQGAPARVLRGPRTGDKCQVRKEPGQKERKAAPGNPIRDEPGGKDRRCSSGEMQGKPAGARERRDLPDSSPKKLQVIRKKISSSRSDDLVKKDEPDDCQGCYEDQITPHRPLNYEQTCKSEPEGHTSCKEAGTQEYDTVGKDNGVRQKWKRSAQNNVFIENVEDIVDKLEEDEYDEAVEISEEKVKEHAETVDKLTKGEGKAKVESGVTPSGHVPASRQEAWRW